MSPLTAKHAPTYRPNKWLVLVGAALLIGLTLTPFALYITLGRHAVGNHDEVKGGAMGRGGQFERTLLW